MLFPKEISKYAKETKINDQSYVAGSACKFQAGSYEKRFFAIYQKKKNKTKMSFEALFFAVTVEMKHGHLGNDCVN